MYTILGAGLSGISASYHLGHEDCIVFEKNNYLGGHIHSEQINGFTWDEGPHVSFTKDEYVRELLADNVSQEFLEYPVETANYYHGNWIPHPSQSNLFALPEKLRAECLSDFLKTRNQLNNAIPKNYEEWLKLAFGEKFYQEFPRAYTEKYWTVRPALLSTDWVGERVFYPNIEDVKNGAIGPLSNQTHYISKIRYPKKGGYFAYTNKLRTGLNVKLNKELTNISFKDKKLSFKDGSVHHYKKLISTIPLPLLIKKSDAPIEIKEASEKLSCSSLLLINITANHKTLKSYNWMYVYDEDKLSTRINCTELLSPENAPIGKTGIQVEVYFSKYKPINQSFDTIAEKVMAELIEMGILKNKATVIDYHTKWVKWANVIFDHDRQDALNEILDYLSQYGLQRNEQDLLPMTNWTNYKAPKEADLYIAGRFAEWKYYWTDDCILRGKNI
ncbi:protoporphyrinogen/coproporphyrinogen oxidase [Pedobacter glucosidilyticus]|uniref:protoporphyrinogen/coproporphyrinogen oxidase n=1 Tax=Pedobacter glucosidilyticus TaxID=1122941 RepID=UPI0003F55029|nr:FAD-dependent oxidoreductase [Pedobacter glucosidilyticus]